MKQFIGRLFCIAIMLAVSEKVHAQDLDLMVIGHTKGVPADLNMPALKSVLKGEKQRWSDGTKVVIALMKTSTPVGGSTSRKIYNMSANELNKYWLALVFQGKADAPTFFNTVSELENFVAQTPGAIGVVSTPANSTDRIISIDAKKSV